MLRKGLLATIPNICSERARLYIESWKEPESQSLVMRLAKALRKVLNNMTIFIRPAELIMGNQASVLRAASVFPEFYVDFIRDELDGKPYRFDRRPGKRFLYNLLSYNLSRGYSNGSNQPKVKGGG